MGRFVHICNSNDHVHRRCGCGRITHLHSQEILTVVWLSRIFTLRQWRITSEGPGVLVLPLAGVCTQLLCNANLAGGPVDGEPHPSFRVHEVRGAHKLIEQQVSVRVRCRHRCAYRHAHGRVLRDRAENIDVGSGQIVVLVGKGWSGIRQGLGLHTVCAHRRGGLTGSELVGVGCRCTQVRAYISGDRTPHWRNCSMNVRPGRAVRGPGPLPPRAGHTGILVGQPCLKWPVDLRLRSVDAHRPWFIHILNRYGYFVHPSGSLDGHVVHVPFLKRPSR